jgi:spore coat polysaccharide biosynthesis protein SpsF (cytidylyltransferase family)
LDRYYQAARLLCADHIVRITADCPLIDPDIIGRVIRKHVASKADYTTNTMPESFPDGLDVEVFTFRALEVAWKKAKLSSEREHVTPYLRKHSGVFRHAYLSHSVNLAHKRWTLDRPEDYRFLKLVYSHLYKKKRLFGMKDVLELLREHPEWETINGAIVRNEGYLASLKDNLRI